MCSTSENDIEDLNISLKSFNFNRISSKCNKCKDSKPQLILRRKDAYCKSCFMANTLHKFKAILGKYRLVRPGDKVLIYHKGGHSTTALLNFIRSGLELDTPKKLKFIPMCLAIVKSGYSQNEYFEYLKKVQEETERFGFPLFFASFKDGKTSLLTENLAGIIANYDSRELCVKDEIGRINERRALIEVAEKLNCKFVFTPEISTNIASQILTNVSLGKGSHLPLDTGFCDTRNKNVTMMRPLRVFDIKELSYYNYFCNTDPVTISQHVKEKSIQNLIENFINQLQTDFPATVTTILKTGEKLSSIEDQNKTCKICEGPIDVASDALTAEKAVNFSYESSGNCERIDTCFSCTKLEQYFNK